MVSKFLINYIQTLLVMFEKICNIPTLLSSDKISNVNRKFVDVTIISNIIYVIALMIILIKNLLMLRDDK